MRRVLESRSVDRRSADTGLAALVAERPALELPSLFVNLEPSVFRAGRLLDAVGGDIRGWIRRDLLGNNGPLVRMPSFRFGTDFIGGMNIEHRADGLAVAIGMASPDPWSSGGSPGTAGALDLEISEDGAVRLYCCAISWDNDRSVIWDETVNGVAMRAVMTAEAVSEATGYLGEWEAGVHITDVKGAVSGAQRNKFPLRPSVYTSSEYRRTTTVASLTLENDPKSVVQLLLGQFNRALSQGAAQIPDFG